MHGDVSQAVVHQRVELARVDPEPARGEHERGAEAEEELAQGALVLAPERRDEGLVAHRGPAAGDAAGDGACSPWVVLYHLTRSFAPLRMTIVQPFFCYSDTGPRHATLTPHAPPAPRGPPSVAG